MKLSEGTGMATRFFTVSEQVRNEVKQRVELIIRHQIVHLYRGVHCFASLRLHTPTSTHEENKMFDVKSKKLIKSPYVFPRKVKGMKRVGLIIAGNRYDLEVLEAMALANKLVDMAEKVERHET